MAIEMTVSSPHQSSVAWQGPLLIGTDTGGTFTDCAIAGPHGLVIGKALSTPGRLWHGIVAAIEDAARDIGRLDDVLARTSVLAHGTTAMLNATLTGAGATVGILTTAGFEDTLSIGRVHQKVAGLAEWERTDLAKLNKSALFRDKNLIEGIRERIDAAGDIVKPVDVEEVRLAAQRLRDQGVTAFAVNFLWSCVNPANEQAAARVIAEVIPGARITCSSDLSTMVGEYERFATCALNAYIGGIADSYLDALDGELRRRGFAGRILMTRAWGDLERVEQVGRNAVPSLFSGPIGGVVGARALTTDAPDELPLLLCADLGGTSLDVTVIHDGNVQWNQHPVIERPLTDAALVAGWLPPNSRMPNGIALSVSHAQAALERAIARPAGMTAKSAAAAVLRIASAQMADLIRKACIERSVDPRQAVPLVYGGAGAQYAGAFCGELGVTRFLVPELASAFSAYGMLGAREGGVKTRSIHATLPIDANWLNEVYRQMEEEMRVELEREDGKGIRFERFAELRYNQQAKELRIPVHEGADLAAAFTQAYERRYGVGASDANNLIELTAAVTRAARPIAADNPMRQRAGDRDGGKEGLGHTVLLWIDGVEYEAVVATFAAAREPTGVAGPSIVTGNYTSVVIPPGWTARWRGDINLLEVRDERRN